MKKYNNLSRNPLYKELCELEGMGVELIIDDCRVKACPELMVQLLSESECTYMRDYRYEDGKIKEIVFEKIRL